MDLTQATSVKIPMKMYAVGTNIPQTGKSVLVEVSKNGGEFAALSPITHATEMTQGWYFAVMTTVSTNTVGPLIVRFTADGCDPSEKVFQVKPPTPNAANIADAFLNAVGITTGGPITIPAQPTLRQLFTVLWAMSTYPLAQTATLFTVKDPNSGEPILQATTADDSTTFTKTALTGAP